MDLIEIAKRMNHRINALTEAREEIQKLAQAKAQAISAYDKKIAVTIVKLKNGYEMELDGIVVKNPLTTITEKIAKGICFQEKLDMELAEANYKAILSNMQCLQAELNGYQSINKYLKDEPGGQ